MPPKRNRNKKTSNEVSLMRKLLKRERQLLENGKVLKVPTHPPIFTAVPWNQLTWRVPGNVANITNDIIATNLTSQLNLLDGMRVNVRLHSVRFWGSLITTATLPPAVLESAAIRVMSLVPIVTGTTTLEVEHPVIQEIRDYPDQVRRAAVGYEWPIAQQSISISAGLPTAFTVVQVISGSGANSVTYFRGWWRAIIPE